MAQNKTGGRTTPVKKKHMTSTDFAEVGSAGLSVNAGQITEDFLRQLQGRGGMAIYREMAENHPVIGATLASIEMLFRSVDWTVQPADSDDQAAIDEAEFVASCMSDMSTSWEDFISSVLGFLVYGYSLHEIVYKRRNGLTDDGTSSKFDDGRIGWRKLPVRAQDTITEWRLDSHGGIEGAIQQDPSAGTNVFLPIEKSLLFRTTTRMNNPQGRSILRSAYVSWYYQKRITEIEAIGIERDLAGMPVALVPPQLLSDSATSAETQALTAIKEIVRNIRRDEQEGLVFPLAYDHETGNLAYDIKLMSTGGRRQFDTNQIIGRYDTRIAMTMLADFLLVGHDRIGAQALSVSKIELFQDSIAAYLASIADVLNSFAVPRLLRINGIDPALAPTIAYTAPRAPDLDTISNYVSRLATAGALMPDDNLDEYLRDIGGLPTEEESTVD
ncbi:MAG: phage portal protein family protein [Ilumatobacteraceae bacterium]